MSIPWRVTASKDGTPILVWATILALAADKCRPAEMRA